MAVRHHRPLVLGERRLLLPRAPVSPQHPPPLHPPIRPEPHPAASSAGTAAPAACRGRCASTARSGPLASACLVRYTRTGFCHTDEFTPDCEALAATARRRPGETPRSTGTRVLRQAPPIRRRAAARRSGSPCSP